MKRLLHTIIFLLVSCIAFAQPVDTEKEILIAFNQMNDARLQAGLDTVTLSEDLSRGCFNHARYLVLNTGHPATEGLGAHNESPELKGYTEEGAIAGAFSVIHFVRPSLAMDGWIRTFYHRIPLLQPSLKTVGIGYYAEGENEVIVLDCVSGVNEESEIEYVCYPGEDQVNLPRFMGPEVPDPVGLEGEFGFPVTIFFARFQVVSAVKFRLLDANKRPVECFLSHPEAPASDFDQWNSICAIPKKPLEPNSRYWVSVSCLVDGKPFKKDYKFETGDEE